MRIVRSKFTLIRSRQRDNDRARGFTLIEVLVTMVLLSLLLPVIMGGLSISLHAAAASQHKSVAAGLARDQLDYLTTTGLWNTNTSGSFAPDHPEYSWTCENVSRDYGLSEVRLTILWVERGQPSQLVVSTMTQTTPLVQPDPNTTTTAGGGP